MECTTCSSTLALIRFFRENGWDVKTLIFGVDTALNPASFADGKEFRNNVKEQYVKWFRDLEKTSNCSAELEPEVVILPGIGRYWGRRFEGAPLAMFNEALRALWDSNKPTFLAVDLTHGINFQTGSPLRRRCGGRHLGSGEKPPHFQFRSVSHRRQDGAVRL